MKTYVFTRYNFNTETYEFRKVVASSIDQAWIAASYFGSLFSITKPTGYNALNVNERINAKGNAGLLYMTFDPLWLRVFANWTERPEKNRLIIERISKRDPGFFSPTMLLSKNTKSI